MEVVAEANDGRGTTQAVMEHGPDVVVMDVTMPELNGIEAAVIDLAALKAAGIIPIVAEQAKVVLSGELTKAVTLRGVGATKGAAEAITKAGGKIEAAEVVEAKKD